MKLRNKKTGDVREFESLNLIVIAEDPEDGFESWNYYHSLAELNGEWEDYTPAEPLIKDEKIRKAVRVWAEASGIEKVLSYGDYFWIGFRSVNTESVWKFECSYSDAWEFELYKEYTIAELCGEEEE